MPDDDQAAQMQMAQINRVIDAAVETKVRAIVQSVYIQSLLDLRTVVLDLRTAVNNHTNRISSMEDHFIGLTKLLLADDTCPECQKPTPDKP